MAGDERRGHSGKNTGPGQTWVPSLAPSWSTWVASSIGACSEPAPPSIRTRSLPVLQGYSKY